jgi:hypothetical protein
MVRYYKRTSAPYVSFQKSNRIPIVYQSFSSQIPSAIVEELDWAIDIDGHMALESVMYLLASP